MKLLLTTVAAIAIVSLGGCNRGAPANNSTTNNSVSAPTNSAAPADTAGKPAGDANAAAPAAPADGAAPADAGAKPGADSTATSSSDEAPPAEGTGGK